MAGSDRLAAETLGVGLVTAVRAAMVALAAVTIAAAALSVVLTG